MKKNKVSNRIEEASKGGVKLSDEQMAQVTGGTVPTIPPEDYTKMGAVHDLSTSVEESRLTGNER